MLKNRFMAAGMGFAILALILIPFVVKGRRRQTAQDVMRYVVLAKETIPPRKIITNDMVEMEKWDPRIRDVAQDALTRVEDAIGRVTDTEIQPNKPIAKGQLKDLKSMGAAAMVPAGKRAMSIQVTDATAVAGFVRPMDRVDILGTFHATDESADTTQTLLQGVQVVAVGKSLDEQPLNATNGANLVTIAVTPEEARWLATAQTRASLHLVLRPVGEPAAGPEAAGTPAPSILASAVRVRPHHSVPPKGKAAPKRSARPGTAFVLPRSIVPPALTQPVGPLPNPTPPTPSATIAPGSIPEKPAPPPTTCVVSRIVGAKQESVTVPLTVVPRQPLPGPEREPR